MTTSVTENLQFRLAARPVGLPKAGDWQQTRVPLAPLGEGEVLIKTLYLSLDPAMRGWMNDVKSYIRPVAIGEVMRAGGVGVVLASNSPKWAVGEHVFGTLGVQQYWSGPGDDRGAGLTKVDAGAAPLTAYLNVLGMSGLTAYFGLLEIGRPQAGETVLVSGAAGSVGMAAGQIAKQLGCRVVGIAGGKEKCDYVVAQLGFDACIDYKSGALKEGLKEHCPQGVDVYFDNVGGEILDTVLTRLKMKARVVICGAISQYNNTEPGKGLVNYMSLLVYRARMEGLVVFDYADRYHIGIAAMAAWLEQGRMKSKEDIVEGIEQFPAALGMLFEGKNFGKLILKVADA